MKQGFYETNASSFFRVSRHRFKQLSATTVKKYFVKLGVEK